MGAYGPSWKCNSINSEHANSCGCTFELRNQGLAESTAIHVEVGSTYTNATMLLFLNSYWSLTRIYKLQCLDANVTVSSKSNIFLYLSTTYLKQVSRLAPHGRHEIHKSLICSFDPDCLRASSTRINFNKEICRARDRSHANLQADKKPFEASKSPDSCTGKRSGRLRVHDRGCSWHAAADYIPST